MSVPFRGALLVGTALGVGLTLGIQRFAVVSAAPGDRGEAAQAAVLARVDGETITVDDFTRELARRGGVDSFPRAASRRALLQDMVQEAKVIAAAKRAGLDRDPEVLRQNQYLLVGMYNQQIEDRVGTVEVSDREVRAFYDANAERYTIPAAARAAVIFIAVPSNASTPDREERRALAERLHGEAAQAGTAAELGALARENSDDDGSRYSGGDTRWLERGQTGTRWEAAVLDAIFALDAPDTLSPVVAGEKGYYVIRLLDRRPASLRPLDAEIAQAIRDTLVAEKRQRRRDELYAAATAPLQVEVREQALATLELPNLEVVDGRGAPPPLPE